MNLSLKTFSQIVQDMGAALQSSATALVDISVGSVTRALLEANASVVLWLQWLLLQVLQMTRASTSTGSDLDSWMQDFGLTRLPSSPSSGIVTFSRYVNTVSASIPAGTTVKTSDGSLTFSVVEDTSLSTWQPGQGSYLVPAGLSSIDLPVVCTVCGTAGNVLQGTVITIAASLPGVDLLTNADAFSNGRDAETDLAFRSRFQVYLAGLSRATLVAVRGAIAGVQQGLNVRIDENLASDGSPKTGSFLVTIDDGSGYPATQLLSSIATSIEAVRPIGSNFAVLAPAVLPVNVSLTVLLYKSASTLESISAIRTQIGAYLNGLQIGHTASVTQIARIVYQAAQNVNNVTEIYLNGQPADIIPLGRAVVKAGNIVVTVNDR